MLRSSSKQSGKFSNYMYIKCCLCNAGITAIPRDLN